jgi:hypothetical protein
VRAVHGRDRAGACPAEALGLLWRDLDLDGEHTIVTVNQTVQRVRTSASNEERKHSQVIFEDAAKTQAGTGRVIVIPSPLLAPLNAQWTYVLAQRQARAAWNDYDLVFPSTRGTPLEERRVVNQFKIALGEPASRQPFGCTTCAIQQPACCTRRACRRFRSPRFAGTQIRTLQCGPTRIVGRSSVAMPARRWGHCWWPSGALSN